MAVTKVWITEGCIVCRACEVLCAEVFDVRDDGCYVRTRKFGGLENGIKQAAADCPVKVIEFTTLEAQKALAGEKAERVVRRAAPRSKKRTALRR